MEVQWSKSHGAELRDRLRIEEDRQDHVAVWEEKSRTRLRAVWEVKKAGKKCFTL